MNTPRLQESSAPAVQPGSQKSRLGSHIRGLTTATLVALGAAGCLPIGPGPDRRREPPPPDRTGVPPGDPGVDDCEKNNGRPVVNIIDVQLMTEGTTARVSLNVSDIPVTLDGCVTAGFELLGEVELPGGGVEPDYPLTNFVPTERRSTRESSQRPDSRVIPVLNDPRFGFLSSVRVRVTDQSGNTSDGPAVALNR